MNNGDKSTDPKCDAGEVKRSNMERLLDSSFRPIVRDYSLTVLGHNPIVPLHLELERLALERLQKDGIYPTKNNTILRVIK